MVHVPKTPGSNKLMTRNKRRLSFSSPTESAIGCLISQKTVLVIINPLQHPHAADCGVGDNVMLIGEVVMHDSNSPVAKPFLSHYRQRLERQDDDDTAAAAAIIHYLVPRIVRNVNGTNVRLQYEALLKRRDHVLQLSRSGDDPNQPGRGPPRAKSNAPAEYS